MGYRQSIEGCLSSAIGDDGLTRDALDRYLERLKPKYQAMAEEARNGTFPHFRILDDAAGLESAKAAFDALARDAELIVILGTGGSSLGGQALAQMAGWSIPGDDGDSGHALPRLRFYDNLDERSFLRGLSIMDPERTRFIVISKSGTTGETLAQTLTVLTWLKDKGVLDSRLPQLFLGVTEPAKPGVANGLRALFEARGLPLVPHPTDIGGRYSAFTSVGLMAGFARGLDMAAFREGAKQAVQALANGSAPADHPAAQGAALAVALLREKGIVNTVMMPYSDRLSRFAAWYVQLWAESLGKSGEGTTPIAALGPVDQHSQLQLYMDGPRNLSVTILRVDPNANAELDRVTIAPALAQEAGAPYLTTRTIGDLVAAQQKAIADALIEAKRPVRTIDLPKLDEATLGELMMNFMIETILAADLLGVDPFDQPAVELGKKLTRQYLAA
jgi:glucose-6-phosphate isomerase